MTLAQSATTAPSTPVVAAICVAEILGLAGFSIVPALLPQFIEAWSLTNTQAGWLAGIVSAGYVLAVIPLVSLTDRRPGRQIYLASSALSALSCFGIALCDSLLPALAFRALAGPPGGLGRGMAADRKVARDLTSARQICRGGKELHAEAGGARFSRDHGAPPPYLPGTGCPTPPLPSVKRPSRTVIPHFARDHRARDPPCSARRIGRALASGIGSSILVCSTGGSGVVYVAGAKGSNPLSSSAESPANSRRRSDNAPSAPTPAAVSAVGSCRWLRNFARDAQHPLEQGRKFQFWVNP